jgi:hypothetical protein
MEIKIIPFQCLVVNKFYWCLNNSTYLEWALKRKICIKLQLAFPQHTAREGRGGGLHIRYKSYGQYICRRPNSEEAHYTKKEIAYILGDQ